MDHQTELFANGFVSKLAEPPRTAASNGTSRPAARDASLLITESVEAARGGTDAMTCTMVEEGASAALVAPMLRAGSLALIAFQLGYLLLDRLEYPLTFSRTRPIHAVGLMLGLIAFATALSPLAMRRWRETTLAIDTAIIACTAWIAVINSDSEVLVASILLVFFASGALFPWSPRWQAALEAGGTIALLGYSMWTAAPNPRIGIAWAMVLSATLLSHLSAVHGARYRRKLAEQLAALAESHRLLMREMDWRAESATARERDLVRLRESEAMLRKVFEASPENIAINSLVDGRFIAVNDGYRVAGYTRDDVMGANVIALGMWRRTEELNRFVESIQKTGRVKDMEIMQHGKDGADDETHLISASLVDVDGEPCVISMTRDITGIKRVETNLRASHAALRKVFDATLDIIVVTRLSDGSHIDFNQQFARFGYGQQDLDDSIKGRRQIWASEEQHQKFRERVIAEGTVRDLEVDFILPNGGLMPALLAAVRVELEGEECVVTMVRDLTAVKEASRKLEENARALRTLFDVSPDAISVANALDGTYVEVNDEFLRLNGHSRAETIGKSDIELDVWRRPPDRQRFTDVLTAAGEVRNMEIDFLTADHTPIPTLISASLIEFRNEPCVVAYIRDITARKRTEQALLSAREELSRQVKALSVSEETFRKLFDANLDSMTLTGVDGVYIDVNQEFVRATGFSREEAVGHHFTELDMWIHPNEMIAFADQLFRTNEVRNLEAAFRHQDRTERPVLISAVNLELQGQLCCLTISREISDLKMTQRELVAAREAALAASRAKSEFLSSMSHEIRTPMNSILGMADLLMETDLSEEQRRYLSTVLSNGNSLLELINSILDLAKVESGRISLEAVEFDIRDVTEEVLQTLAIRAHEKGLELMGRFAPEVAQLVVGDPLRLGQILINLIGNAIKFTQKGQVLVSVERDPNPATAGGVKFTVTDTGIGIAADKLHLLFDAFSQADSSTSRKYGGSGLGLAIVSRLVALMRGAVDVQSEPGTGSTFSFTAQFGMPIRPASERHGVLAIDGTGILLVDDNADCRSIVSGLLRARGAQVTEAATGTEAMAELDREELLGPRFRVVVLDNAMPAPGGFEVARHLMRDGRSRPQIVMMLSTSDLTSEVGRLRTLGLNNYIVKPIRRAELFAAIVRAREGLRVELRGGAPAPASPSSAFLDRPLQILMADDSPDNRALIRAYLKKTPYLLEEADDGRQAIDKFISGKFDLVLMDIQMPIVDGYEATTTIRNWERENNRRRTPIVALTASALKEAVHRTKAAGCDAHVTKPVKKSTLLEAIRDSVEGDRSDDHPNDVGSHEEETWRTEL